MQPEEYGRAVGRRWRWLAAAAITGALVAGLPSWLSAPVHRASVALFVGITRADPTTDLASSSHVQQDALPSLAAMAASPAVSSPVAGQLHLTGRAADLLSTVEVTPGTDASVLEVTVAQPTAPGAARAADAVGQQVAALAPSLFPGDGAGSLIAVTPLGPAVPVTGSGRSSTALLALLGLALGAGLGAVAAGLAELGRPRVDSRAEVAAITGTVVLGALPRRRARWRIRRGSDPDGAESLRRLRSVLPLPGAGRSPGPLGVLPVGPVPAAVLDGLTAVGELVVVRDPDDLFHRHADLAGLLLVVDDRRTSRRSLRAATAAAGTASVPLVGVVVHGTLPPGHRLTTTATGSDADTGPRQPATTAARVVATLALLLIGLDRALPLGLNTAVVAGGLLVPSWTPVLARFRGARLVAVLTVLAVACGFLLAVRSSADHQVLYRQAAQTAFLVLGALGAIGVLLWARTVLPLAVVGATYALGQLISALVDAHTTTNPFKFQISLPLSILVLSLVAGRRQRLLSLGALAVLGFLDITHDARSAFGFCAVAAVLVLWQLRRSRTERRARPLAGALLLAAVALTGYLALTQALVSGALGAQVQARTVTQIDQTGNLLLGGRPEWTATWALLRADPLGFGFGVVPTPADGRIAQDALSATRIPTVHGYLEHYLFDGHVELHSILADLWAGAGPAGVALAVALAGVLVRAFSERFTQRRATGLMCSLLLLALWYLAFGPAPANLPDVAAAVGLLLIARPSGVRAGPVGPPAEVPAAAVASGVR